MTQEEIQALQAQIKQEMRQARINTFCLSHGIDPSIVTYEDGKLIIPISF